VKTIVASHNPDLARDFDRDLLRRRDLRLVTARSIPELVERLRAGGHVCFVDRVLPDGDAESALDAIRSDSQLQHVPVVLVAAQGAPVGDRAQARSTGFADVVDLPAPPGALSLLVARLLGVPLREDERFAVRVHVFGSAGAGDEYLGTSVDLSENGMLLKAKRDVPVGTVLGLRFTLPARTGELTIGARVVRSDDKMFAPARGLALSFDGLSSYERGELHDYLRVLVSGRPFSWQVAFEGSTQIVSLSGVLRADSDLEPLRQLKGDVVFRLREFRRIGSDSVQRWIDLVRQMSGARITLEECPIAFVHQANLITNLLDRQTVRSLYAPYACDACGLDEEKLLDVARDLGGGKLQRAPEQKCSACSRPLTFDELPDRYFSFLAGTG
jgi:CheY-like chemotaxis protein